MTPAPIVGVIGNDVPRQIVSAAGAVARRLTGTWSGAVAPEAADHLGAVDLPAARILTELLTPGAPALDAIVVCNDSQAHLRLFYVLRMLRDRGLPPVHLLDVPRQESVATRRFARAQLHRLLAFCVETTGTTPDAAAWRRARDEERAVGEALERLRRRRHAHPAQVPGTAALAATLAAASLPWSEAVETLDGAHGATDASFLRVHVTGSSHPDPTVYAALEERGITIVGEDHDTGELSWIGVAADGDDAAAVCDELVDAHFVRATGSAVATIAQRASTCRALAAAAGAHAALAWVRSADEAPLWDLAACADALADDGVPMVRRVGIDPTNLETAIAGAVQELRSSGEAQR
ncbi:hypothetical protein ASD65_14055 [Microbacterium sp. Root61]|uniref:2-hydroxyacyl-CoA dehydratase family protein n=1 Tax=Microbacterium sp. Root61 TaxID=1736570 RepID=UPI0007002EFC|nr:2-hydroxyacyl-CoA dehydratase family protein [Microbacterium sp. Root61]KRA25418.1 hypothetical protein ASD65_14055 [Microbacterium sp. Root61]